MVTYFFRSKKGQKSKFIFQKLARTEATAKILGFNQKWGQECQNRNSLILITEVVRTSKHDRDYRFFKQLYHLNMATHA